MTTIFEEIMCHRSAKPKKGSYVSRNLSKANIYQKEKNTKWSGLANKLSYNFEYKCKWQAV